MSSNDLERLNRRRIVLAIMTVWLVMSVFIALGAILEPRVFALITPPSLQSYSGGTSYQAYVWAPQRRPFLEIANVSTALIVGLLSGIAVFIIWKRLGFPRRSTIIASLLMALASFLGIRMFPYLAYAAPLILTVYSLARLPQSPVSIQVVDKPRDWQRISRAKKWFLQIASFVVIVVISFGLKGFVASHFERIVRATGFPPLYKHTIVWILNVAIPLDIVILLAAGVATYVIWSRIGASGRSALIGGSLMIAIHLPEVSCFASLFVLAWVIICIAWPRLREKRRLGQTIVFVVLAGMLLIFSALVDDYIVYGLFTSKQPVTSPPPRFPFLTEQYDRVPTDSPIVWVLAAAIPLIGGLVPYAIWRKVWDTSQKNALVIGHLMAIPVALWMSGAALALITGLLVYVSPLNVKGRIAVQTGVTCLVTIALGFSWETAFVMFMALGLYIIWLYVLVPLVETALIWPESGGSDISKQGSKTIN